MRVNDIQSGDVLEIRNVAGDKYQAVDQGRSSYGGIGYLDLGCFANPDAGIGDFIGQQGHPLAIGSVPNLWDCWFESVTQAHSALNLGHSGSTWSALAITVNVFTTHPLNTATHPPQFLGKTVAASNRGLHLTCPSTEPQLCPFWQ